MQKKHTKNSPRAETTRIEVARAKMRADRKMDQHLYCPALDHLELEMSRPIQNASTLGNHQSRSQLEIPSKEIPYLPHQMRTGQWSEICSGLSSLIPILIQNDVEVALIDVVDTKHVGETWSVVTSEESTRIFLTFLRVMSGRLSPTFRNYWRLGELQAVAMAHVMILMSVNIKRNVIKFLVTVTSSCI